MKNLFILAMLLFASTTFAQEGVKLTGNTLTIKTTPPTWPGCEGKSDELRSCFSAKLSEHISSNFKFPEGYKSDGTKQKVTVEFIINTEGKPQILKVTGGTKELQEEAKRNIMLIPEMTSGNAGGKPRATKYTVPFTF